LPVVVDDFSVFGKCANTGFSVLLKTCWWWTRLNRIEYSQNRHSQKLCLIEFDSPAHFWHKQDVKETKTNPQWPKIVREGNATVKVYNPEPGRFRIVFHDSDGKRKFLSESTEAEAMAAAKKKAGVLSTFGARVANANGDDMAEHLRLTDMLKPYGVTLAAGVEALDKWLHSHKTLAAIGTALSEQRTNGKETSQIIPKLVPMAVQDFLGEHQTNGETSELHAGDLRTRLDRFVKDFTCDVSSVDVQQLQTWLSNQNGGAANYNHNRRILSAFFGWCYTHRYHFENPAATPKKSQRIPGKLYLLIKSEPVSKKHVFRPAELARLMEAVAPITVAKKRVGADELLAMLAFCAFAGVRTSEFIRLRWQDVDFAGGRMIVGEDEGKTSGSYRSFKLSPNLLAGLEQFKARKGFVWTNRLENFEKTFQQVNGAQRRLAKMAGLSWKQNAPRHSYISYRLIQNHAIADVASDAGNSPAIIHKRYKVLRFDDGTFITEQNGAEWFNLKIPTL
jgi:integrase